MTVLLGEQCLRFRIKKPELEQLLQSQTLTETLALGQIDFSVSISSGSADPGLQWSLSGLDLRIPPEWPAQLQRMERDRHGLKFQVGGTRVALQVDLRD